jgi:glycosyltransferase involved in cell wall biosynthesis
MATPLHVVLYHPDRLPVPRYGGTERVVVWLARGLAELGHRVTLIAGRGTRVAEAHVIEIDHADSHRPGGLDIARFLPANVDVVHAHVPLHHVPGGVPLLWTFHGNAPLVNSPSGLAVGVSADHARRHGLMAWVHNGLDPADYQFTGQKRDFDLFVGRLHSVKGWQWAVAGARRAHRRLTVVGGWRPTLQPGLRFVGRLGGTRKTRLLADAACLWMPAQWEEPFGLTTIEAMVSGTPVLATRRGALPEIITAASGRMGDTLDDLVALRGELGGLDPEAIRANVLTRFTHRVMAANYEKVYRQLSSRAPRGIAP